MAKKDMIIIADYEHHDTPITLREFLEITHIPEEEVYQLIQYDIIHPQGHRKEQWQFDLNSVQRFKRAMRLQKDLELNLASLALVLDLLDEMEEMRTQLQLFKRIYK